MIGTNQFKALCRRELLRVTQTENDRYVSHGNDGVRDFSFPEDILMLAYSASEFREVILDIISRAERHDPY